MAAYQFKAQNINGFLDEINAGINYQDIEESRFQRDKGKNGLQSRIEDVSVAGYNLDVRKFMGKHELTAGIDGQSNGVTSTAHTEDIVTGNKTPLDTRYPDGGSRMLYQAVYAQHIYKIVKDKLVLNDGVRFNYVDLQAKFNDKTFYPFPFSEANMTSTAWSGNLGLAYMPCNRWRFTINGSTGFRAPNIDDIAKVFESAGGVNLVVPNPNLKPEYTYNADLGISYFVDKTLKVEANGFYTWFRDAIIQDKFTLNGADSVVYNGKMSAVVASQNKAKAFLYGFSTALTARLAPNVTFYSTINFTYGRYYNVAGIEVPMDHIPPIFGKTSILYEQNRFTGEAYVMYNGWKRLQDYSPSGEDNLVYATPKGMPSWYTLNTRVGYKFLPQMSIHVAIENILDYNYRIFASGISAPGRNFVLTLRGHL
jgi:hemoglobin/transferrin/lactoferrin receptor protein